MTTRSTSQLPEALEIAKKEEKKEEMLPSRALEMADSSCR